LARCGRSICMAPLGKGSEVVGIRDRLRRLELEAQGEMIAVPQRDGTVARFPSEAAEEAFMNCMERLGAGEDAPPEHPLIAAARNSSDPEWSKGIYAVHPDDWIKPVPDLSE
jgi:hypothetical protein